jgi:hypothetical protein
VTTKEDLLRSASDVASNPITAKGVPTATTGLGLNEIFKWVEGGVAFAATIIGMMATIALWRKLRTDRREAELRIQVLENQLSNKD